MNIISLAATVLCLAAGIASAQMSMAQRPAGLAQRTPEVASKRNSHEAAIADCIRMWDSATHMTRKEWSETCRRVQARLQRLELN
jgi:hypothetical protein